MSKGITRTIDLTTPFGATLTLGSSDVKLEGYSVALQGSPLTPHGPIPGHGELLSIMNQSSLTVKVNGKGVVRAGDVATCGDIATGSSTVTAGD